MGIFTPHMIAGVIRLLTGAHARWVEAQATPFDASKPGPTVFFANHSSNLDGPVIWASLPYAIRKNTRLVAARDYWLAGPIRRYFALCVFNCVLVERKKVTPSNNPLRLMEEVLEAGQSLILFPAGTRSVDDEEENVGEFKPGLWHLARNHPEARFVPVYLENLNRILPKGDFIFIPLIAAVRFGPAVALGDGESKEAFFVPGAGSDSRLAWRGGFGCVTSSQSSRRRRRFRSASARCSSSRRSSALFCRAS